MRTLSSALATALGAPVQTPAVLVQVDFPTPRRWSSFADLTWNGQTWNKQPLDLRGLVVGPLSLSGTLLVDNRDGLAAQLVLSFGVQDRRIEVWGYDAAATGLADVVWLGTAVGGRAGITDTTVEVALRHRCEHVSGPRQTVSPEAGFGSMLPAGAVVKINGTEMRIARET